MTDPSDDLDLPRKQVGPNPQHLIITLLGDFWNGRSVPVPSSALVEILQEFDISEASARSALSRLAKRGILALHREGRSTAYSVREEFLLAGASRADRNLHLGAEDAAVWDGRWVLVTFSTALARRHALDALRADLLGWGFAPIQDGLWASVSADESAVRARLEEHAVDGVIAFSATLLHPADRHAVRGMIEWPIDDLAAAYRTFFDEHEAHRELAARGAIAPREALVLRTRMMDSWRSIVRRDPGLPHELLPADWPRPGARAVFASLYDSLGPLAEARCRQIIAKYAPEIAEQTRHMTTAGSVLE
jgi:phenylacetic acid degradation operon negative regulatory protein